MILLHKTSFFFFFINKVALLWSYYSQLPAWYGAPVVYSLPWFKVPDFTMHCGIQWVAYIVNTNSEFGHHYKVFPLCECTIVVSIALIFFLKKKLLKCHMNTKTKKFHLLIVETMCESRLFVWVEFCSACVQEKFTTAAQKTALELCVSNLRPCVENTT